MGNIFKTTVSWKWDESKNLEKFWKKKFGKITKSLNLMNFIEETAMLTKYQN